MSRVPAGSPGPMIQPRSWYLWSYLRVVAGLAIMLVAIFISGDRVVRERLQMFRLFPEPHATPTERLAHWGEAIGFDVTAPMDVQFVEFLYTYLTHPIIAGPMLVAGVTAVVLTWRHHR